MNVVVELTGKLENDSVDEITDIRSKGIEQKKCIEGKILALFF